MVTLTKNRNVKTANMKEDRQQTVKAFMDFVDKNSISVPNFKFKREDCYA